MRLTNARYINCKKSSSVRMIFGLLAVLFAGGSLLTGCRREREETGSSITGPFYVFGMDQDFRFGEVNYTYSSDGIIHERDELIGFIIREEDAETFEREDGYLLGWSETFMFTIMTKTISRSTPLWASTIVNVFPSKPILCFTNISAWKKVRKSLNKLNSNCIEVFQYGSILQFEI